MTHLLAGALLLAGAGWCYDDAQVTGYVRSEHGALTYDGTPIWTDEPIVAASWDIPLGWHAWIDGVGTFRVADRGSGLGSYGWLDVAVWSRSEAFALTSRRAVCVYPPPEGS